MSPGLSSKYSIFLYMLSCLKEEGEGEGKRRGRRRRRRKKKINAITEHSSGRLSS
jgi:hypothetical protein